MKITKSRLLQIIREEVELHEKNTIELDETFLSELGDENEDGEISKKEFNDEIDDDQEFRGLLDEMGLELEESDVEEDQLLTKKKPHEVIPPKKQ